MQKAIPANSKEIAVARSYGDLRENHEYKAAKEMQKILMRRKGELEVPIRPRPRQRFCQSPHRCRQHRHDGRRDGSGAATTPRNFTIWAPGTPIPTKGIISYLTPVGQALLNPKPGEEVEVPVEGGKRRYRIDGITAVKVTEAPVAVAAGEPAPPAAV